MNKVFRMPKWLSNVPRNVKVGVIGVILLYSGVAGIDTVATPWWLGRGDAPRHIDYAYSVYHLHIPRFTDHLQYEKFNELANGSYRNQPAAINPPLFYALHAPLIGPLFDSGQWHKGIALGKTFNIFLGILCIISLAWAGWLLGGRNRQLMSVGTAAIGGLSFNFTVLNDNYAVDVLLVLFSTLSFILSYKLLAHGITKKYILFLGLLSILGMSTKASYIVPLFTSLLALPIASILHTRKSVTRAFIRGCLYAGGVVLAVVLTAGWYYYFQNYRVNGSWFSSAPDDFGSKFRTYKSYHEVLTSSGLWGSFYEKISSSTAISKAVTYGAVMGIVWQMFKRRKTGFLKIDQPQLFTLLLMAVAVLGILATQIVQAEGYGNFYFRYFLPVLLPFSLFIAYGLSQFKVFKGQLITLAVMAFSYTTLSEIVNASAVKAQIPGIVSTEGLLSKISYAATQNGASSFVPSLLLLGGIVGAVFLAISLFRISSEKQPKTNART